MERFFEKPHTLLRMHEGPLGAHLGTFAEQLNEQNYGRYSSRLKIRLVADFSRWLKQRGTNVQEITSEHMKRYLRHRARHRRPRADDAAALTGFLGLLREKGIVAQPTVMPVPPSPCQLLEEEFSLYLRQERGFVPTTVTYYLRFIHLFLIDRFAAGQVDLSVLCAADVVRFVQCQAACLHRRNAKLMTTALRSFLQYARYRGYIQSDLAAAVPAVANWSMASIPKALPPEHVEQTLASCNRQTAVGRRDYAILLLLVRLGLRAGEIAFLELKDINWEAGHITVRGKGGYAAQLPLPVDVGEAVAAYLQAGRPEVSNSRVFLRVHAPIAGFQRSLAVSSVVNHAFARAGISPLRKGAHQFRHTLACRMLRQGASLAEIGELLRHRSPDTTAIYAKVDLDSLHELALPWPGGSR